MEITLLLKSLKAQLRRDLPVHSTGDFFSSVLLLSSLSRQIRRTLSSAARSYAIVEISSTLFLWVVTLSIDSESLKKTQNASGW